jgi:hypothetical protein
VKVHRKDAPMRLKRISRQWNKNLSCNDPRLKGMEEKGIGTYSLQQAAVLQKRKETEV